jgi:single-stranded-DNA-specific exonuclease
VLTQSGDYVAGSARSIAGFNVYEAVHQCKDLLIGYGGHYHAAGMTMRTDNVHAFRERFEEVVSSTIAEELLTPEICIDAEVETKDLTPSFYNIINQMEPFGPGNCKPVLMLRGVMDSGYAKALKEQHLRFTIVQNTSSISAIGFNMARYLPLVQSRRPIDVAFTLDINEWNGNKALQMRVVDVRESLLTPPR